MCDIILQTQLRNAKRLAIGDLPRYSVKDFGGHSMPLSETVLARSEDLTPAERKLVSAVLAQPRVAALATVTEMARDSGVHEATVSRLARKLGFDSFAAFRSAIREEFLPTEEAATRMKHTLDASEGRGVIASLVQQEHQALARLLEYVDEASVSEAARRIREASRIFIYAQGNAEALELVTSRRLRRFGRDLHSLTGDARTLAENIVGLRSGDLLLVFAFRRVPRRYAAMAEHARMAGASILAICDTIGPMLVPAPDLVLAAPRSSDGEGFHTLSVPMAIVNAIIIALGSQDEHSLQTLERLGGLIRRFE